LAQRRSRKRRKERPLRDAGASPTAPEEPAGGEPGSMARGYARGRAKDEAARAALVPLAPGERPKAVTVAGVVAFAFAVVNLAAYLAGGEIQDERPNPIGIALFTLVMAAAAYGCFRVRYWAVLGMQTLLGLLIVVFSVIVIGASTIATLVICLAVIAGAGTLFWFLVKSMARIQLTERLGRRP